jgi:hypothetical protein
MCLGLSSVPYGWAQQQLTSGIDCVIDVMHAGNAPIGYAPIITNLCA